MGQRLCLGKALINDPELLLMDEPAAGLDPKARVEFKNLVRILSDQGKTLIISSHILSELEEMCDTLLFIDQGQLIHQGPAAALLQKDSGLIRLEIRVTGDVKELIAWGKYQETLKFIDETNKGARFDCHVTSNSDLATLLKKAIQNQLDVYYFSVEERKLEDIFIEIVNQQRAKK
jgi:ABC-2 type transport system ATP-binding protein